jgi:hypothetical protein
LAKKKKTTNKLSRHFSANAYLGVSLFRLCKMAVCYQKIKIKNKNTFGDWYMYGANPTPALGAESRVLPG